MNPNSFAVDWLDGGDPYLLVRMDVFEMLSSLPDDSIDLVCSDFPYCSLERHRKKGTTTRLKTSKSSSNEWFDTLPNEAFIGVLEHLYRVLKPMRHAYLYVDDETESVLRIMAESAGFYIWKSMPWVKTKKNTSSIEEAASPAAVAASQVRFGMGYHYPASHERILFLEKRTKKYIRPPFPKPKPDPPGKGLSLRGGAPKTADGWGGDVFFAPRPSGYPTEKPVSIWKILIEQSTEEGMVVLDPFFGSGSAIDAAVQIGRRGIGSDSSLRAFAEASERLMSACLEGGERR